MQDTGGVWLTYQLGTVYSVEYIDQIRKELEENLRCPLRLISLKTHREILCCLAECPFRMRFVLQINPEGEEGYQLTTLHPSHRGVCVQNHHQYLYDQKIQFITHHRTLITNLVRTTPQKKERQPSKILLRMAQVLEISPSFLVDNLSDCNLRRMIKKKFDNIVGQVRRTINEKQSHETKTHKRKLENERDDQSSSYVVEQESPAPRRSLKRVCKLRRRQ